MAVFESAAPLNCVLRFSYSFSMSSSRPFVSQAVKEGVGVSFSLVK